MSQKNRHWILGEDENRKTKIKTDLLEIFGKTHLKIDWENIIKVSYHLRYRGW